MTSSEPKTPDYIILEDDRESQAQQINQRFAIFEKLRLSRIPEGFRFLAFFLALGSSVLAVVLAACALATGLIAAVTLFKVPFAIHSAKSYYKGMVMMLVITVGMALAVFSPRLGIGLILLQALFHGESKYTHFFKAFVSLYAPQLKL